jgi:hypothetical protein
MALQINDNGIDRPMTADEEAAHLAWAQIAQTEAEAAKQAEAAKAAARQAVLDKLGLTAAEAAALFGQ